MSLSTLLGVYSSPLLVLKGTVGGNEICKAVLMSQIFNVVSKLQTLDKYQHQPFVQQELL